MIIFIIDIGIIRIIIIHLKPVCLHREFPLELITPWKQLHARMTSMVYCLVILKVQQLLLIDRWFLFFCWFYLLLRFIIFRILCLKIKIQSLLGLLIVYMKSVSVLRVYLKIVSKHHVNLLLFVVQLERFNFRLLVFCVI